MAAVPSRRAFAETLLVTSGARAGRCAVPCAELLCVLRTCTSSSGSLP